MIKTPLKTMLGVSIIDVHPKASGLIFDIDGTLVNTMPAHFKAWQEASSIYGFEYTEEMFYETAGMSTKGIVKVLNSRFGYTLCPHNVSAIKEEAYLKRIHEVSINKSVAEIVYKYHGKLPMALGTGGRREVALRTIKAVGLDKYFDVLVTSEDVENHKPEPDTFIKCAQLMGIPPDRCQVFEDAVNGFQAAEKAGMIITDVRPYLVDSY